ncbi:MAG TPA: M81 family metallopeptidase [Pirellulales bacterium]|nr:M81 family metallopeptidase [Pirellulales bacterium]
MRIALGQLWQETNTFNPLPTTRADFEQFGVSRGAAMIEAMCDTNELGAFIQSLRDWPERPELVGLVRLPAWPGGAATAETFRWLLAELVGSLERELPVDAVLLALHGAMAADEAPDVEGEVLEAVRRLVGPEIPIVATLDLHANVTRKMVESSNALVLFHTAPHIDVFETGLRGARVLRRILVDGVKPVAAFHKLPMVVPAERANSQDPASVSYDFRERLQALERDPRVLTAGLATVQPWLDIPEMGTSVLVATDGARDFAEAECQKLADQVWRRRRDYLPELVPLDEAVRRAYQLQHGLVVLSDSADATTSGAPGDSNWLLQELLKYRWTGPVLVAVVAPEVVAAAAKAGIGAELTTPLGGVRDRRFSKPFTVTARVERLFDARFTISGHLARNLPIDMGPSAVLRAGDVSILLTSRSGAHFAPEFFRAAGFDPFAARVLVAKSPCGFRAAYQPHAREIMVVKAPGCAPSDFWNYEYRRIPRPLWPWDEVEDWKA